MRRPAAPTHGAASAVKQPQLDVALAGRRVQGAVRFVNLPGARQHAAVFVRVGIAEHHFLMAIPGIEQPRIIRIRPQHAANLRAVAQVFDGFKQRHRHQSRIISRCRNRNARQLREPRDRQDIFSRPRAADDIALNRLRRIAALQRRDAPQRVNERGALL